MRTNIALVLLSILLVAGSAPADTIQGFLNDETNGALVGSDLGPALFGDDWEIANNVAIYDLTIPLAGNVRFLSLGFAAGGIDPYFTLFDSAGTFVGSNYIQAFSTGGDFDLTFSLAVGDFTAAIGAFANMSLAENYGSGTLADGFTGLGGPGFLGNYYYEVAITHPEAPIPEPATFLLLAAGLGLIWLKRRP